MTILSVTKMWSRTVSMTETQNGQTFACTFQEAWQVEHSADATELEILDASGLPRLGELYLGTYAPCRSVGPVEKLGPVFSIVNITYRGEVGPGGIATSPVAKLPEYVWSNYTSTHAVDEDVNGKPIVTVNGEPIEGVVKEISDQQLQIKRNYLLFSPHLTHQYLHSVNSDPFAGFPAGTARLTGYTATLQRADGFEYWAVDATIRFRYPWRTTAPKAWWARVLHQGIYVKVDSKCKRAVDCNKEPVTKPVPMDAAGTPIVGANGCCPSNTNAHFLEFELYNALPYSALGLL